MTIEAFCAECNVKLKAPDSAVGKKIRCPRCKTVVPVPAPDEALEVLPDPPPTKASSPRQQPQPTAQKPKKARRAEGMPFASLPDEVREWAEEVMAPREEIVFIGRSSRWVAFLQQLPTYALVVFSLLLAFLMMWWADVLPTRLLVVIVPVGLIGVFAFLLLRIVLRLVGSTRYFLVTTA